jgi:peptidoglycan/LPS O-acetylase OafA/YrhL
MKLKYQKEIDGLRALAVLSIILFHFFKNLMPNGYLGVDIFFIISGYLITSQFISLKNYKTKKMLITFYSRRIKRLFPAFFIFLTITTLVLVNIFLNSDIEKFSKSLLAAKTFWANIYFWRDGGYFGGNDQLKPLLHIWSLSVEEQFYLFFPTFILICLWLKRNYKIPIITNLLLLIILSFTLWIYLNLIDGQNPAFFLLPTRAWLAKDVLYF